MENTQKNSVNEVDLLDLLVIVWRWIELAVQKTFVFLVRKSLWFIAVILVMLVISYFRYTTQRQVYSTMMIARMNVQDNAFAINYLNNLNASASNPKIWQRVLNLPDTLLAQQVKSVGGFWGISFSKGDFVDVVDFNKKYTSAVVRDSLIRRIKDCFFVKADVYNSDVLPYLTKGLVDNICNNPFIQEQNVLRKAQARERIAELNRQIRVLDSAQRYEYFVKNANPLGTQLTVISEKEKKFYHDEILRLHGERQWREENLLLNPEPVTVIQGFGATLQQKTTFFSVASPMVAIAFLLALILSLAWDNRKWLVEKVVQKHNA